MFGETDSKLSNYLGYMGADKRKDGIKSRLH